MLLTAEPTAWGQEGGGDAEEGRQPEDWPGRGQIFAVLRAFT